MSNARPVIQSYLKTFRAKDFLRSGYVRTACVLSVALMLLDSTFDWMQPTLSIVPSLLGFTFAAFAILIGVLGNRPKPKLDDEEAKTNYKKLNAALERISLVFFHILFFQITAVIYALFFGVALNNPVPFTDRGIAFIVGESIGAISVLFANWIGVFLLFYSIILVISAVSAVVRVQRAIGNAALRMQR